MFEDLLGDMAGVREPSLDTVSFERTDDRFLMSVELNRFC